MRGLLIVDHGSRRPEANSQLEEMAERVRRQRPGEMVAIAHMEIAAPSIADGIAALVARGVRDVRVLPYFLSDGRHSREDIPRLAAEAAARHPGVTATVARCLGPDDLLARLLLERAGI